MAKANTPSQAGSVNAVIEDAVRAGSSTAESKEDGALVRVPLDDVGPHPDQPRQVVHDDKLRELMAGIVQTGGLLQPISIRPSTASDASPEDERPYAYRLIAGQRRLEAYRRLRASTASAEAARPYATIPAIVRLGRDRADALKDAILENIQRDDLVPLDAAEALAKLKREAGHKSAKELAAAVGQKEDRVKRLLRLNEAPELVKSAMRVGLLVNAPAAVEQDGNERAKREHLRRLDLMEALEFARLHEHHLRKVSASRKPTTAEQQANDRTRLAIERAVKEGWGFRRIQEYVEAVLNGKSTPDSEASRTASPPLPLFKATATEVVVRRARFSLATAHQLGELVQLLRELLGEVERARATLPALPVEVPENPPVALTDG